MEEKSWCSVRRGQGSEDQHMSRPLLYLPPRNSSEKSNLPLVLSSPRSSPQVWTFGDMTLSSGSSGRYSVKTVTSDHGVVSSLVLSKTLAQDFQLRYNCTAWNHFGTGTALVRLREQGTYRQGDVIILNPLSLKFIHWSTVFLSYNSYLLIIWSESFMRPLCLHTKTFSWIMKQLSGWHKSPPESCKTPDRCFPSYEGGRIR